MKQTGTGTTYYLYDGTTLVCEMDASGAVTATNTFGANGLVSRRTGTTSVFYTFDPQGSVAQRLDASGNILSNDLYDAYGNRLAGNPGSDPYGYGGQWGYHTDVETGLILCTYRYYDPLNGHWLTRDPIGYEGGINLYGYVLNTPVNEQNPLGLSWDWIDCMAKCIADRDPLSHLGKGTLSCLGASVPKCVWKKLHIRVIRLPGDSPFASPPSALSVCVRGGGRGLLRTIGTAANYVWMSYGLYMAGVEISCLKDCLTNTNSHRGGSPASGPSANGICCEVSGTDSMGGRWRWGR